MEPNMITVVYSFGSNPEDQYNVEVEILLSTDSVHVTVEGQEDSKYHGKEVYVSRKINDSQRSLTEIPEEILEFLKEQGVIKTGAK